MSDDFGTVATKYGCTESECRGIDYVELKCPPNTAKQIALFYDSVFDATTSVISHGHDQICMVAIGDIHENGNVVSITPLSRNDGTIASVRWSSLWQSMLVLVKRTLNKPFRMQILREIVWVNPRFQDDVTTLQGARHWKQFRFKDISRYGNGKGHYGIGT